MGGWLHLDWILKIGGRTSSEMITLSSPCLFWSPNYCLLANWINREELRLNFRGKPGVSMASLTELSFNWNGFISAMISNISFTYRSIYSKKAMTDMYSTNLYAYISIIVLIVCIPPAIILEVPQLLQHGFNDAIAKVGLTKFVTDLLWVGLFYYLYNQSEDESWQSITSNGYQGLQIVKENGQLENQIDIFPSFSFRASGKLTPLQQSKMEDASYSSLIVQLFPSNFCPSRFHTLFPLGFSEMKQRAGWTPLIYLSMGIYTFLEGIRPPHLCCKRKSSGDKDCYQLYLLESE